MKYTHTFRNFFIASLFLVSLFSCSNDDDSPQSVDPFSLEVRLTNQQISNEKITAIGFSNFSTSNTFLFYHVADGATNIEFFKTENTEVDRTNYSNYREFTMETNSVFGNFEQGREDTRDEEYYAIVKYMVNNEVRLSNPIKVTPISQPNTWTSNIGVLYINQSNVGYPKISWENNTEGETSFSFCIITSSGNVLANVVTEDNRFQYFDTSNVLQDFTQQAPEALTSGVPYFVYLLDVNADNWLNRVVFHNFLAD
ncbi:hypothetical protein C8N46_11062 [Kordia periserrulae]|uniref:Uncharacterized protein n=1 Tax=Kordia periserrulae TaxID=701523 RepID=A0A2T6BT67_9FLAO|nr:hypothetical protein [Kordia periserrulae]PTX59226.1 hypothetical protein C8N46_11062 [Kordia periserrulae]